MRAVVQGEKQLFSMPNNSAIMVSFAACFALRLSTQIVSGTSNTNTNALAPSVHTLIEETADVMEKLGNITRHRNGMCGLYAKYLRILVRKAAAETGALSRQGLGTPRPVFAESSSRHTAQFLNTALRKASGSSLSAGTGGFSIHRAAPSSVMGAAGYEARASTPGWSGAGVNAADLFPFSSMSGDQIVEALTRAGGEFDVASAGAAGGGFSGGGGGLLGGAGAATPGGGFGWDDSGGFDFLPTWSNWPDLGF